jgi:hypothetical protein
MKESILARNTGLDAKLALLDGGALSFYTAPQPANADTAITTQTLLGTGAFSSPAFAPSAGGVATAEEIFSAAGIGDGDAAWARAYSADGTTAVLDLTVGTADADIIIERVAIDHAHAILITSASITAPDGT